MVVQVTKKMILDHARDQHERFTTCGGIVERPRYGRFMLRKRDIYEVNQLLNSGSYDQEYVHVAQLNLEREKRLSRYL